MTEISRPWNGTTIGDAGPYSDADWQELYRAIIGWGGGRNNNGVFLSSGTQPDDGLKVTEQSVAAAGITVHPGAALVQGIAYLSDADKNLTIATNASGNPRIDTIILRSDYALQTVRLAVLQGTPAATPAPPALTQTINVMWEIPIADVAVANGFVTIVNDNITPRQEWVNAPPGVYLDNVLNNSGVVLETGDVVIWDATADRAVTTTILINDSRTAGVWQGRTAAGGYGRVLCVGIGYVRSTAAITRGNYLVSSTTVKQASASTNIPALQYLAQALETTASAGLVLCYVQGKGGGNRATIADQKAAATAGGASVDDTWTTRVLNTEIADPAGIVTIASNQFTPIAGVFNVKVESPFVSGAVNSSVRIRLRNVTGATVLKVSSNFSMILSGGSAMATLEQVIVANGTDAFDVQYFMDVGARVTNGLGKEVNEPATVETYTVIELEQLA